MKPVKMKSGKWAYNFMYQGKRYRKQGIRTKTEAAAMINKILNDISLGLEANSRALLLNYYVDWVEATKMNTVGHKQYQRYMSVADKIENYFSENLRLRDITSVEYQKFINHYAQGLTKSSVSKIHSSLKACMDNAVHDGLIPRNPVTKAHIWGAIAHKEEKDKYLEIEEFVSLRKYVKQSGGKSSLILYLMIITGARFSEINRLKRSDIQGDTLHIRGTKTESSDRFVEVSAKDISHVKKVLSKYPYDLHGDLFNLSYTAVATAFKRAKRELGIGEEKTPHCLRHTHCSYLLSTGCSLKYVSQRLGHKNTAVTAEVYSHLLKKQYTEENIVAIQALDELENVEINKLEVMK